MKTTASQDILSQLDGATISTSYVEDEDGLHICLADGRIFVIAGHFAISIIKTEMFH